MDIGSLMNLAPTVNFASRSQADPGTEWGPRIIPDWQWFYVVSGEAKLQLGSITYKVVPGECVYYGPGFPHKLSVANKIDFYSMHFSWSTLSPEPVHPAYQIENVDEGLLIGEPDKHMLGMPGNKSFILPHHFSVTGMEPMLMRIVKEYQKEQFGYGVALRALLLELIVHMVRGLTERAAQLAGSKIDPALQAMRERPDLNWSVTELAETCGYHPSYFTKLFFEEIGTNPKPYLIAERIKQAKQALLGGEPMERIASRLGYSSVHYFSYNFKKETGLTPSDFRQEPGAG